LCVPGAYLFSGAALMVALIRRAALAKDA